MTNKCDLQTEDIIYLMITYPEQFSYTEEEYYDILYGLYEELPFLYKKSIELLH